jgi:peroxiredoxin
MKLLASFLFVSMTSLAQTPAKVTGDWTGSATSHHQEVPIHLRITGTPKALNAALINGPENSPATDVKVDGNHLLIYFNYYDKTLDATVVDGKLTGSYGTKTVRYPLTMTRGAANAKAAGAPPKIDGDWEVEVKSAKGEAAWQLRVAQTGASVKTVIQRIDGDTGSLYGTWNAPAPGTTGPSHTYRVSHFTAAGPALYALTPKDDGTLIVTNMLRADLNPPDQQNLVARRPEEARAAKLPPPTDPTQQTTMKDPTKRFVFKAPDLTGKIVANTDRQFDGKVVIVTVGGSWCPNCHDEAPFLESLYKQFHAKGLEIVNLSFEEDEDQLKDPVRLRAFIARYHLDYTVLLAGTTDQLNEKIPDADHLNSWPTSFILGRDGRVKQVHAGFAGPANPQAHEELVKEMTALIGELLAEPAPVQNASIK